MEKLRLRKIAMGAVVLCSFSAGMLIDTQPFAPSASYAEVSSDEFDIKGMVKGLSRKAKMITLDQKDKGFSFVKFDDKTVYKNIKDITQLKVGEKVLIHYKKVETDNIALKIEKLLIKLPEGVTEIKTAELKELIDNKKTFVLVDARPSSKYKENHIPGAVSVPYGKLKKIADDSEKGLKLLPYDKDALLVFYCGGDTWTMSPNSASLAKKWGFKNMQVYVHGIPDWKKAGNRTTPDVDFIKNGNIVLVDLRSVEKVKTGYIPHAYTIPLAALEDAEDLFPEQLGAPIIFYSDNDDEIDQAVKMVSEWDFKNVIGFYGGLDSWKKKDYELHTGPAMIPTEDNPIYYTKILGPGEISITDFEASLKTDLIYVVDARTPEEHNEGHFPGSVNIPLEDMQKRMKEIPKDKFVIVHCKTGGRGEIGYRLLKDHGYSAKFLNAECECDVEGGYEIW